MINMHPKDRDMLIQRLLKAGDCKGRLCSMRDPISWDAADAVLDAIAAGEIPGIALSLPPAPSPLQSSDPLGEKMPRMKMMRIVQLFLIGGELYDTKLVEFDKVANTHDVRFRESVPGSTDQYIHYVAVDGKIAYTDVSLHLDRRLPMTPEFRAGQIRL